LACVCTSFKRPNLVFVCTYSLLLVTASLDADTFMAIISEVLAVIVIRAVRGVLRAFQNIGTRPHNFFDIPNVEFLNLKSGFIVKVHGIRVIRSRTTISGARFGRHKGQ
jgi:hypothetical protein